MISRRNAFLLVVTVMLALGVATPKQESLVHRLVQEDLFAWYQAQTSVELDRSYAGAYVMLAVEDELYLGLSTSAPSRDRNGALFAAYDGAALRLIAPLNEQDVNRMRAVGDTVYIPGYDPNDGWDAGNLYRYDTQSEIFTTLRYRYSELHFVDATTTDADGKYSFSGLKPTSYIIKFVLPTGYSFTAPQVGYNFSQDSNPSSDSGIVRMCENARFLPFQGVQGYEDLTIDAGVVPITEGESAVMRGTTELQPDRGLYFGQMSIGDLVWVDSNGDGLQSEDEPGLADVRVELYTRDPYFPCVIHASGFWGDAETGDLYYNGGVNYSNITFMSHDFGESWQIYSQDGEFYWARDFVRFNEYFYKTHREIRYEPSITIDAAALFSHDGVQWSRLPIPEAAEVTFEAFDGTTWALQPMEIDEANALVEFQDRLLILAAYGNLLYAVTAGGTYETIPIDGADLSGILPGFHEPDFPAQLPNAVTGASNRHNTLANANDELLYAVGGDNILYATPDLRLWYSVADFNTVDDGAPLISVTFWDERQWLVAATAGEKGSIYYLSHGEVLSAIRSS